MFTLSEKIRVINTPEDIKVFDDTNAELTTAATVATDADTLHVLGYGQFEVGRIVNIKMRRGVAAAAHDVEFAVTVPANVAIGDAIEVEVILNTTRYSAEVLTAHKIAGARTFRFVTAPLTGITAANIAAAIVAGYTAFTNLYTVGTPLVTVSAATVGTTTDFKVVGDAGGSVIVEGVRIKRIAHGTLNETPVRLVPTVVTEATEGHGTGKFLEESISMATPFNTDPYGVDNTGTRVDLRALYTEVTFEYATEFSENLATNGADYGNTSIGGPAVGGVPANHTFTMFLNESTCMAADDAAAKLTAIALERATTLGYLSATVIATPTTAQERAEVLILADGSSTNTTALFIA